MLAKKFEGEVPITYLKDCIEFWGITEDEFWKITDNFRSPHLWEKVNGSWKRLQELPELM